MTVQANILKLLQRVDPTLKTMAVITASNISTWATDGGDKFQSQRIVDCYNEARLALYNVLNLTYDRDQVLKKCGAISIVEAITFTLSGSSATASRPAGYVGLISLATSADVPMVMLPLTMYPVVRQGVNPHYTQSASNIAVFESATGFFTYGTFVTTGSGYIIAYYKMTTFTLSDVTGGSTTETYGDEWSPTIIELATAIANGLGNNDVNAFAQTLIKTKG